MSISLERRFTPHAMARDVFARIAGVVSDHARKSHGMSGFDIGNWLEAHGFANLIGELLSADTSEAELAALADLVAAAVRGIAARMEQLCRDHLEDVLIREPAAGGVSAPATDAWSPNGCSRRRLPASRTGRWR